MRFLVLFSLFFGVGFAENFSVSTTAEFRQALKIASENNLSNTIVLREGFYSVVEDGIGQLEYNSTHETNLTIIGEGNTTLSGENSSRIILLNSTGLISFENLNFIDGNSSEHGGAIYVESGDIQVWDSNFSNNSASGYYRGGAIYGSNIEVVNSTFTSNSGGAISGDEYSNVEVTSSTFT
jgi:predicted outer membrane repeat protein